LEITLMRCCADLSGQLANGGFQISLKLAEFEKFLLQGSNRWRSHFWLFAENVDNLGLKSFKLFSG